MRGAEGRARESVALWAARGMGVFRKKSGEQRPILQRKEEEDRAGEWPLDGTTRSSRAARGCLTRGTSWIQVAAGLRSSAWGACGLKGWCGHGAGAGSKRNSEADSHQVWSWSGP